MRLLRLLVRLFPREFRDAYGAELLLQLRKDRERARTRGRLARAAFPLKTALDLLVNAVAERVRPSASRRPDERPTGQGLPRIVDDLRADLWLAVRRLRRTPAFTLTVVASLTLAIGPTVGAFHVVEEVLLDPLPYPDPDRLVYIAASAPGSGRSDEFGASTEFYVEYRESADVLVDIGAYSETTRTLRVDGRVERVPMATATPSLFTTLGMTPILGRLPTEGDGSDVALISHGAWINWFGADPEIVGRVHDIGDAPRTIVGVMGPEFGFPRAEVLVWIPDVIRAEDVFPGRFSLPLVGRLAPEVGLEAATDRLTALARGLPERFGGSPSYARLIEQHRAVVRPLAQQITGPVSETLWLLLGAALLILLVACANVANLFVVRAETGWRDVAVRRALGAGRGRLVRAQITEAALVSAVSGVLAALVAWWGVSAIVEVAPADLPRLDAVSPGPRAVLSAGMIAALVALTCGWAPTLLAQRPDLGGLREGARGATRRQRWGRDGLVVAQTALALVLLIGSTLLVRSFDRLRRVDPGYATEDVLTFRLAPEGDFRNPRTFVDFHLSFVERVAALPGVLGVGVVQNPPLASAPSDARFVTPEMPSETDDAALLEYTWTAGDYFEVMGIDLLEGRDFTLDEQVTHRGSAIVSRSVAERLWPGVDPLGRRFRRQDQPQTPWLTVIGVVGDVRQSDFRDAPQPTVYLPLIAGVIPSPAYVVKSERARSLAPDVQALVREVAPRAPLYGAITMEELRAASMARLSFAMLVLVVAASLAFLLGVTGLYGVLAYLVTQRVREIGVRMALGADAGRIRSMIVARGAIVALLGLALGSVIAVGAARSLEGLLYGIRAVDPPSYVGASLALLGAALLASYAPASRASRVDPNESLRAE